MTVKVVDKGARRVLAELRRSGGSVEVGILGTKAGRSKGEGITVGDVAEWAEFGIGQPQRSWLRAWVDNNEPAIRKRMEKEAQAVMRGERTERQALQRLGVWLQGMCQKNLADFPANGFEPNAPATIERKGSSTPLVDTGQLRSSISHRVK